MSEHFRQVLLEYVEQNPLADAVRISSDLRLPPGHLAGQWGPSVSSARALAHLRRYTIHRCLNCSNAGVSHYCYEPEKRRTLLYCAECFAVACRPPRTEKLL